MKVDLTQVLIDFALVSLLLVAGAMLRKKIRFFQVNYIPVALIGGVLGILVGPHVLGKFSPIYLNFSDSIKQWAGILSAIVFSCSFLGLRLEKVSKSARQTYFLAGTIHQVQVIVGLGATFLLGLFIKNLKFGFGILPVLGFYGGHSMAIAGGTIFDEAGYMDVGAQVGATFATVGMLFGVIFGMFLINRAARKGETKIKMDIESMPESLLSGYYDVDERPVMSIEVTSSSSLDPLGSQLMIVGALVFCGYMMRNLLIKINPFFKNLPLFACCLIFSAIFCIVTQNMDSVNNKIDRSTVVRISGTALDYMIVSSIATTSLSVFSSFAIPLIVVNILVAAATYVAVFKVGDLILHKDSSFETKIGLFGQCCGVLATGLLLLKVVDPDFKTNAVANITSSSTLGYTYQLQYTLVFIALLMTRPLFVFIWSVGLLILLAGAGIFFNRKDRRA